MGSFLVALFFHLLLERSAEIVLIKIFCINWKRIERFLAECLNQNQSNHEY